MSKSPAGRRAGGAKVSSAVAAGAGRAFNPAAVIVPAAIILLFSIGIFIAPYHFPVPGPTGSQSWEFGFSNTAADGFIALMLLALFGWLFISRRAQPSLLRVLTPEQDAAPSMRPLLMALVILELAMLATLLIWYAILPYSHYGEFTYFIQRLEAAVLGRVPYRDFTFEYGPSMLYLPLALYHLCGGRLSVEAAYFSTLLIHYLLGFALLAYLVSRLRMAGDRVLVFLLLAIPFINLSMGLNYTPFRFLFALSALFGVRHLYLVSGDRAQLRWLLLGLAALFFPLLTFSVSPEMGLALTFALLTYFGWFFFGPEKKLAVLILPVIASVAMALLIFPRAYFDSMLSFGKGGASFPIFPTVHIVAFLAAAIWLLPRLGIVAVRDKGGLAPFAGGLAILSGLLILPATGRCDFGHVYFNSITLFLLALAAATWLRPAPRYIILGIFFVIFPLIDQITFWNNYEVPISQALDVKKQLAAMSYPNDNYDALKPGAPTPAIHYSKLLPMPQWLDDLPDTKIGLPLGADEGIERYLILKGRLAPEYHIEPFDDIFEPSQLDRKFADLRTMEYIIVPKMYIGYLQADPDAMRERKGEADDAFMSSLLLFPIHLTAVHTIFQQQFPIMRRIAQEYSFVKEFPSGLLLKRKD